MTKVQSVLSSIVFDLTIKSGFNEMFALSELSQRQLLTTTASITSARKIQSRMTKSIDVATAKVLTAATVVSLPSIFFERILM